MENEPPPSPDHAFANFLRSRGHELFFVCAALVIGIMLRIGYAPDGGFDREFDGAQGSFFAFSSINYERLGFDATGGYPVVNLDTVEEDPSTWFVYGNHSPLFALWEWASLKAFGPEGWEDAWREGRSPSGLGTDHSFEFALRLPMFIASILSLLALWWAIRIEGGKRTALIGLLLYGLAPLAVLDAGLVNYEPPSILFVLLAYGFFAKLRVRDRLAADGACLFPKELLLACLMLCLGTAQTFAPLFFALPLCCAALLSRMRSIGFKHGVTAAVALGISALIPIFIHGIYVRGALDGIQPPSQVSGRIATFFEPLLSGEVPLGTWLILQYEHLVLYGSQGLVDLAAVGLLFALFILGDRWSTKRASTPNPAVLPVTLAAGGFTVLFGYYTHTADDPAQSSFMLNMLPAAAALGALALVQMGDAVGRAFARNGKRYAGVALTATLFLLTANGSWNTIQYHFKIWRDPEPAMTMPEQAGADLADLVPPGAIGFFPESMSFTSAVPFYAWRTLLPIPPNLDGVQFIEARIAKWGLADQERFLLLPDEPPEHAKAGAEALEAFFMETLPELASKQPVRKNGWRAWSLSEH